MSNLKDIKTVILFSLIFLAGCSYGNYTTTKLKDHDDFVNYYFFQRNKKSKHNQRLIIYLEGSPFNSVLGIKGVILPWKTIQFTYFLQKDLSNDYDILVPEIMNVNPGEKFKDDTLKLESVTLNNRVNADTLAINSFLNKHSYKYVYLIGYSEGGMLLPKIYNELRFHWKITKLINIAGGGYSYKELISEICKKRGISTYKIDSTFTDIEKYPNSLSKFAFGNPYKKWSSFMNYKPSEEYKKIDIPIFLIQGTSDVNVPVESSRFLKKKFDEWGKNNLTYLELKNMDHGFNGKFDLLIKKIEKWLSSN